MENGPEVRRRVVEVGTVLQVGDILDSLRAAAGRESDWAEDIAVAVVESTARSEDTEADHRVADHILYTKR